MIEAVASWATHPVPTPAGVLLLLLSYRPGIVRRLGDAAARRAGLLPSDGGDGEDAETAAEG